MFGHILVSLPKDATLVSTRQRYDINMETYSFVEHKRAPVWTIIKYQIGTAISICANGRGELPQGIKEVELLQEDNKSSSYNYERGKLIDIQRKLGHL